VIKDLGIYFESDFSFKFHYKKILNNSYIMLGFINRNTQHFKQPYKVLFTFIEKKTNKIGS